MLRSALIASLTLATGVFAAELSEKFAKRLESADGAYQTAVMKADNIRFYALQKATADRVKVLKTALADATKAGDFDAATELKARLAAAESAGVRSKPKNVVKFGGHEYALITEQVTWHVARRLCEEMGGHLAVIETAAENDSLLAFCKASKTEPWIGATDEVKEGLWTWVDGSAVSIALHQDNANGIQHYLLYHAGLGTWDDGDGGSRHLFVCEWDS